MANSIRMRARASDGVVEVKALIKHEMETGLRKDSSTGELIPAHYIQEVMAEVNGEPVMTALWGPGVSKNPYLAFQYKGGSGDTVKLSWTDNEGMSDSSETRVR